MTQNFESSPTESTEASLPPLYHGQISFEECQLNSGYRQTACFLILRSHSKWYVLESVETKKNMKVESLSFENKLSLVEKYGIIKGSISLHDLEVCTYHGTEVYTSFANCKEEYRFKTLSFEEAKYFAEATLAVAFSSSSKEDSITKSKPDRPASNQLISTLNEFLSPGDLILFQTSSTLSKIQRFFTKSQWDHVGIVVPQEWGAHYSYSRQNEQYLLYETVSEGTISCPLIARLLQYKKDFDYVKIAVRKLVNRNSTTQTKEITELHRYSNRQDSSTANGGLNTSPLDDSFVQLNWESCRIFYDSSLGTPFSAWGLFFNSVLPPSSSTSHVTEPNNKNESTYQTKECKQKTSGYFCSEMVASFLHVLGILSLDEQGVGGKKLECDSNMNQQFISPSQFWPRSFVYGGEIDKHLRAPFRYTSPIFIDMVDEER